MPCLQVVSGIRWRAHLRWELFDSGQGCEQLLRLTVVFDAELNSDYATCFMPGRSRNWYSNSGGQTVFVWLGLRSSCRFQRWQ